MKIFRVEKKIDAVKCEELLNKQIKFESKYDPNINFDANAKDFFDASAKNPDTVLFAVEVDNQIVAFLHGYIKNPYKQITKEKIAIINLLYVEKTFRNNKIATNLIIEFTSWAKTKSAKYLEVETLFENEIANICYKNLNFEPMKITYRKDI